MSLLSFLKSLSLNIGIDLGTANTVISIDNDNIVLNEPSVVAMIEKKGEKIPYAFGLEAKKMLGKTPIKIDVIKPLKDGVISDFLTATEMIKFFIFKILKKRRSLFGPKIIICVPSGSTQVERKAIQESAEITGAREVFLIEETMAGAIGADLDILEANGFMIIGIGGGTMEIGVLSLGEIIYSDSLRIAGDKFDEAIIDHIKKNFNLLIGSNTAEQIKFNVGNACFLDDDNEKTMEIFGRDLGSGIPIKMTIGEKEVSKALYENINKIIEKIKSVLEIIPPELSTDINQKGIVLTGGGALLKNFDYLISKTIGIKVVVADKPLFSVINGIMKVFKEFSLYEKVLFKQM
ncbi:MAG: rod shape-determining protein [Rickettsiales bacterium]|jgi:rod shape-determining protein MreB|nr:rod shape-determining protein [Rickettsiales bacterium]